MKQHRDSQKRIYFEDAIYSITCKTKNNREFFREKIFCDLFVENLRICKKLNGFLLYAWVLVWDHFHLLVKPSDDFNLSGIMHFLKRHTSRNINIIMCNISMPHIPFEGEDGHPRLRGVDVSIINMIFKEYIFRFRFKIKYLNQNPFPLFKWQKSYHDHYIRNDKDFAFHWEYIKRNPEKHKLPDCWPYVFTNPEYENLNNYIY